MNNEAIETFITVAKTRNISKAAKMLFVSQATVSYRISQLEKKLSATLIIRNKGGKQTELTLAGKNFLPLAQSWVNLNREIENFHTRPEAMELTIGLVNSANNYLFPDFYNQLKDDIFDWRLSIKTLHSREIYEMVQMNQLDFGFPIADLSLPSTKRQPIHSEQLMVVSRNRINGKKKLLPKDLAINHQIYIDWGEDYRRWHNLYFPMNTTPKFSVDTAKVAMDMLDDTLWFFAPYSMCLHFINGHHQCTISHLELTTPTRTLYMVTNPLTEQTKRRQIILFKRRVLQYVHSRDRDIQRMLASFSSAK